MRVAITQNLDRFLAPTLDILSSSADYPELRALEEPLCLKGPVVKGFGRGSKELGIPTANLDAELLGDGLADVAPGVYCGWASVGAAVECHKMVMSIGW